MSSPHRMKYGLTVAAVIAVAAFIGWVARSTRAQDNKAPALPTPGEASKPGDLPTDPSPPPGAAPAPLEPQTAGPTEPGLPTFEAKSVAPPPIDSPAPSPAAANSDDPEKNARDFVEQNRKVARDELKKLKDEAERLRARLGKVEAGIRRWEALVAALDADEKPPMARATPPPRPQEHVSPEKAPTPGFDLPKR